MTLTLTQFLLARIAEDEEIARDATNDGHKWLLEEETISLWPDDLEPATGIMHFPRKAHAYHAVTWSPERVLAECEAKWQIVDEWRNAQDEADHGDLSGKIAAFAFLLALRHLATSYADHPDYDEAWRP